MAGIYGPLSYAAAVPHQRMPKYSRLPYTLAHQAVHRTVQTAARRLGYSILWDSYYNGLPRFDELPRGFWDQRTAAVGVSLSADDSLHYLETELQDWLAEYRPPSRPTGRPGDFYLSNGSYGPVDAEVLYAMIRRHRPGRVLELGSGFSSLVIGDALSANAADGDRGEHVVVDPFPRADELGPRVDDAFELRRTSAAEVSFDEVAALQSGDILFIDTTHTVKIGSEVVLAMLEFIPRLAPGVLVHIHDVFLPWHTLESSPRDLATTGRSNICFRPSWRSTPLSHHSSPSTTCAEANPSASGNWSHPLPILGEVDPGSGYIVVHDSDATVLSGDRDTDRVQVSHYGRHRFWGSRLPTSPGGPHGARIAGRAPYCCRGRATGLTAALERALGGTWERRLTRARSAAIRR